MIKIAVLDSPVKLSRHIFKGKKIANCHRFSKTYNREELLTNNHGTAVCGLIFQFAQEVEIVCFPIFDEYGEADPEEIISALHFIKNDGSYHIINMSMGFSDGSYETEINAICNQLKEDGVILVASFDNGGEMTYPACLESVIGVDISGKIDIKDSFWYNEKGCINIIFPDKQYAVNWGENDAYLVRGTSFAAAELTGKIASYLINIESDIKPNVTEYLSQVAKVVTPLYEEHYVKPDFELGRVALFPYCKETVAVVHSQRHLVCELVGIYDYRFSSHVGESLEVFEQNRQMNVQSDQSIPWENIDTLVIGYTAENNNTVKKLFYKTVDQALTKGVHIYSLDNLSGKYTENQIWYPEIGYAFLPKTQEGKLWPINKPVIAVVGTGPQQGKFTTQVNLVNTLRKLSYSVGWIATEPTGYLFGADYVFAYGYHSTVSLNTEEYVLATNKMLHNLSKENDIIILSLQSSVLHLNTGNVNQLTIKQHAMMFGAYIDAVVLCVNGDDDDKFIESIISYLEVCFDILVAGFLVYPLTYSVEGGNLKKAPVDSKQLKERIYQLKQRFKRPALEMNDDNILEIAQIIVDELSDED